MTKRRKVLCALIVSLIAVGIVSIPLAETAPWKPNLPLTQVQLTVVNGATSYFVSTFTGVPAGFDIVNGVYLGWCVDRSVIMVRHVAHNVKLYSSLTPPSKVSKINWIAINYILNHKQGNMIDIQEAIWHFTDSFSSLSAVAQKMVKAANANPKYDPNTGAVLAVICFPQGGLVQDTIIELGRPTKTIYNLNMSGYVKTGTTITLRANLTLITETLFNTWIITKGSPVSSATIVFYSCDKNGQNVKELGTSITDKNGIATFSVTLTHVGDYWYVAKFT